MRTEKLKAKQTFKEMGDLILTSIITLNVCGQEMEIGKLSFKMSQLYNVYKKLLILQIGWTLKDEERYSNTNQNKAGVVVLSDKVDRGSRKMIGDGKEHY